MNNVVNEYVAYNTADFMGTGSVSFDYISSTYSIVFGSLNYSFNANANETLAFQVTYHYCSAAQLASTFSSFSATLKNEVVGLQWKIGTDVGDRRYLVQESENGNKFQTVRTIHSDLTRNGRYQATVPARKGTMYYRVVAQENGIEDKHSGIRAVANGDVQSVGVKLYPNPAQGVTEILFHPTRRSDYYVEAYTLTGQLVAGYNFKNALQGKINLRGELKSGLYLIKIRNIAAGTTHVTKLVMN